MNLLPPPGSAPQLAAARAVLERHLRDTLHAIHLFGSAVDGGLKPHSDIDLFVTVTAPPSASVRHALMHDLLAVSAWPGTDAALRALEVTVVVLDQVVPWRYPARRELQFGEWLRADLAAGHREEPAHDHDLAILLTQIRQRGVALFGLEAAALFDPVPPADFTRALADTVAQWTEEEDWRGDEQTVVLALARIWYSACTGGIAAKDRAAEWAIGRLPENQRPVLAAARAAYLGEGADFPGPLAPHIGPFVRHVKAAIARAAAGAG